MTSVRYRTLLFSKAQNCILIENSSSENFSQIDKLRVKVTEVCSEQEKPIEVLIHQIGGKLVIYLVILYEDGCDDITNSNEWLEVDDVKGAELESVISFLYSKKGEDSLLKYELTELESFTREYLTQVRLEPDGETGGWVRQSVHPDENDPGRLVRVGWSAKGESYHQRSVGVIGTSLGILTSLLVGVKSTNTVIQDSIQTLRLLQNKDGGWVTNDTNPISVIPSTTFALWALRVAEYDPKSRCVQNGLEYIRKSQHSSGGWGLCKDSEEPSVFNTCRALQILKKYDQQGDYLERGRAWLQRAQNEDGGWGIYSIEDRKDIASTPAHTAHVIQTLFDFEEYNSQKIFEGKRWLFEHREAVRWQNVSESAEAIEFRRN